MRLFIFVCLCVCLCMFLWDCLSGVVCVVLFTSCVLCLYFLDVRVCMFMCFCLCVFVHGVVFVGCLCGKVHVLLFTCYCTHCVVLSFHV